MRPARAGLGLALLALALGAAPARAYFDDVQTGARAQAMGTAGMAMIDDVTAYSWNPSALDRLDRRQAYAAYGKPLGVSGLYTGGVAYGGRAPGLGSLGLAVAWNRYGITDVYAEDLFSVSAGQTVKRFASGHALALGGSLKYGHIGIASYDDPVDGTPVDFGSRSALSFDTAVGWRTPWKVDFAWVATDWNRPDFGFIEGSTGTEVPTVASARRGVPLEPRVHGRRRVDVVEGRDPGTLRRRLRDPVLRRVRHPLGADRPRRPARSRDLRAALPVRRRLRADQRALELRCRRRHHPGTGHLLPLQPDRAVRRAAGKDAP